jgi:microcystin-dependent protein
MSEPFLGQVIAVAFNFAPVGWVPCDGRLLDIAGNEALYNLLGTAFGGDGATTFGVPDLRGRVAVGQGQRPGYSNFDLGQAAGTEKVTLTSPQVGAHRHGLVASAKTGTSDTPGATMALGVNDQAGINLYGTTDPDVTLAGGSITATSSSGLPHENRQPVLAINYIMASAGLYPSRP